MLIKNGQCTLNLMKQWHSFYHKFYRLSLNLWHTVCKANSIFLPLSSKKVYNYSRHFLFFSFLLFFLLTLLMEEKSIRFQIIYANFVSILCECKSALNILYNTLHLSLIVSFYQTLKFLLV